MGFPQDRRPGSLPSKVAKRLHLREAHMQRIPLLLVALSALTLFGCEHAGSPASTALPPNAVGPESLTTNELLETLRRERTEELYYTQFPQNVKELMVRPDIVPQLIGAFDRGGDDLYRFNVIVVLNHRSALGDSEKASIAGCLERALQDSSGWVRTEAVWGLGLLGTAKSIPSMIPLLDDPDPNVVNETVLALFKLNGTPSAPFSNENMSAEDRRELVEYWKGWWEEARPK